MERKGPHKSMHCKFCKPPGNIPPEKPGPPQVETKTKLHLSHQAADLKILDIFDEPGEIEEETDVCICQLEGYEPCPKCAPDKKRKPIIKKVCDCPLGAKPKQNVSNLDRTKVKIKKKKVDDDEFWWEKYNRERDAVVKETWAAYLAQRKQDKKLIKCREKGSFNLTGLMKPIWYQKLSCQQTIYLEYLSTAIRLDLDEKIMDRTSFVLGGIGFHPRPKRRMLEKCLRYCHYNTIRFLNQLSLLFQEEDPYKERVPEKKIPIDRQDLYAWNDRILMSCICYLEFPKLLREIMDRLPPLPQEQVPPPIPIPRYPRVGPKRYDSPYDEPIWRERLNWLEEQKINRINRAREHLNKKRMEIPSLALMRRPSLIDARPTFLGQIEASQSFQRRKKPTKKKARTLRRKGKPTFDSKVDVTAIAGIEASEVSTTPKADSEEICVFLREKESEASYEDDEEEGEEEEGEDVKFEEDMTAQDKEPEIFADHQLVQEAPSDRNESAAPVEEVSDDEDIPFVTPPKNESGTTVERCLPPKGSPGPPASHYDVAKRELGLVNQDLCVFDPNDCKSSDEDESFDETFLNMNVEFQLKEVAKKLRALHLGDEDFEEDEEQEEEGEKEKVEEGKEIRSKARKRAGKKKGGKGKSKETKKNKKSEKAKEDKKNPGLDESGYNKELENMILMEHESQALEENEEEGKMNEASEVCPCARDRENESKMKRKKGKKGKKGKKKKGTKRKKKTKNETWSPCQPKKDETEDDPTGFDEEPVQIQDGETEQEGSAVATGESDKKTNSNNDSVSEDEIFYGDVQPLLKTILRDLSDEGFISAGYVHIEEHPDIKKLIRHLKGEIVRASKKKSLYLISKEYWRTFKKQMSKYTPLPDLNVPLKRLEKATWNDKNWITSLTRRKKEEFYFKIAKNRATEAKDFYLTLFQEYFGTERFLNSYYAYMIPARKESIMRGIMK